LKATSNRSAVEGLEHCSVAEDVKAFERGITAGKIGHPEFVDEVGATVGSAEGDRCVVDGEQKRSGLFRIGGASRRNERGQHEGRDENEENAASVSHGRCRIILWL
jgi:hypothetical protein